MGAFKPRPIRTGWHCRNLRRLFVRPCVCSPFICLAPAMYIPNISEDLPIFGTTIDLSRSMVSVLIFLGPVAIWIIINTHWMVFGMALLPTHSPQYSTDRVHIACKHWPALPCWLWCLYIYCLGFLSFWITVNTKWLVFEASKVRLYWEKYMRV